MAQCYARAAVRVLLAEAFERYDLEAAHQSKAAACAMQSSLSCIANLEQDGSSPGNRVRQSAAVHQIKLTAQRHTVSDA